jgi:hypothetical protein
MAQKVFRRKRRCGDDERPGRPVTMKTDENVDNVRTLVRNDAV